MEKRLTIGRVARETGCKVQTIRYYEQIGLLRPPERTAGNQRIYDRAAVDRLAFIRHARALGFPLPAIRDLLRLSETPAHSCDEADAIARDQLQAVETRIEQLSALKTELKRMIRQCEGGAIRDCRVIESLSDHGLCATDHAAPPPM